MIFNKVLSEATIKWTANIIKTAPKRQESEHMLPVGLDSDTHLIFTDALSHVIRSRLNNIMSGKTVRVLSLAAILLLAYRKALLPAIL